MKKCVIHDHQWIRSVIAGLPWHYALTFLARPCGGCRHENDTRHQNPGGGRGEESAVTNQVMVDWLVGVFLHGNISYYIKLCVVSILCMHTHLHTFPPPKDQTDSALKEALNTIPVKSQELTR